MKIQNYLVAWDDYRDNCIDIENQFKSAGLKLSVLNSGTPKDGWNNLGDIRYYRQFYYALKDFNQSNDYLLFICGDVSYDSWKDVMHRANDVLSKYKNVYAYATQFTHDAWGFNSTNIKISELDSNLSIATCTNGTMMFIHRDIVNEMLAFFDYFQDKYGWEGMVSGWAIDIIYASVSIGKGKIILRDSKHILTHPVGSSYTNEKAGSETGLVFKAFTEFSSIYDEIINKIHLRFNRDPQYMDLLSFYSNEFDLELA
jgi:hypothetical protein